MFDLSQVNFASLIYEIIKALIISGTTALITYLICKHYAKHIKFAKKMKKYGFEQDVVLNRSITKGFLKKQTQ